ncbi:ASCH domain-containing protein [Demequina sp. SO4-13]|uniref:ASCH domain-containing protein n=1 Tax=Demequina sp. SO4-13 TaxID=3401027 RepID=UPI003AF8E126
MSIRPRFVSQILAGSKTVELRRTKPLVSAGQPLAIYSTLPAGAIVATARVARIERAPKRDLWNARKDALGVTEAEFESYFAGRPCAIGVHLDTVVELDVPVSLTQMRTMGVPNPPQQWMFLRSTLWQRHLQLHDLAVA